MSFKDSVSKLWSSTFLFCAWGVAAFALLGWHVVLAQSEQELANTVDGNKHLSTASGAQHSVQSGQRSNKQATRYLLQDQNGQEVRPIALLHVDDEVYFLGPQSLWLAKGAKKAQPITQEENQENILILTRFEPSTLLKSPVRLQEFNDFIALPKEHVLVILDKSGDMFSFSLLDQTWSTLRANAPSSGAPDPDYLAFCSLPKTIALLDPERNQIWKAASPYHKLLPCTKEILPWCVKAGQIFVGDCIAIAADSADDVYLLKRDGRIVRFGGVMHGTIYPKSFHYLKPSNIRPSRLCSDQDTLYVVERENNRVLKIDRSGAATKQFIFDSGCDLRGIVPSGAGFWIISGKEILYRNGIDCDPSSKKINAHAIDSRLKGLILPIAGQYLPCHPGVYPGARRLYRFGVHEGLDMFNSPGAKVHIAIGTPVRAAKGGRVIRADTNFADMDFNRFNQVMNECRREHRTSSKNEDLFRGCQVWIDHGNGLVTRYAHLSKANPALKVNMTVKQGDLLGYVGVSGTGENLPGHVPYPHLHFEIWLDGKYVGYGLTPAEIVGVYQDIFQPRS